MISAFGAVASAGELGAVGLESLPHAAAINSAASTDIVLIALCMTPSTANLGRG